MSGWPFVPSMPSVVAVGLLMGKSGGEQREAYRTGYEKGPGHHSARRTTTEGRGQCGARQTTQRDARARGAGARCDSEC